MYGHTLRHDNPITNPIVAAIGAAPAIGSAAIGALKQAASHGYDMGNSFVNSLIPSGTVEDLPPLSKVLDGPVGAALVGAAIRETAQEQRQAEYERTETLRRTAAMAYHQRMADQYQSTGRGYYRKFYHLSKVRQAKSRKFRRQRYYGQGERVLKGISNYGRRERREFWQGYHRDKNFYKGYQARRWDERRNMIPDQGWLGRDWLGLD